MSKEAYFTTYNNKTRKGLYLVGWDKKGKRHAYKVLEGVPLDFYYRAVTEGWKRPQLTKIQKQWTQKTDKAKKARDTYRKKLQKKGRLSTLFKPGSTVIKTELHRMGKSGTLRSLYKRLFSPLVLDTSMMDIVLRGKHKLKNRMSYQISVKSMKGGKETTLATFRTRP